mgnify:CR=1 FL=1
MVNPQQAKGIEKGANKGVPVSPEDFAQPRNTVGANVLHTEPAVAGKKTSESSDEALKRANEEKLVEMEKEIGEKFSDPEKEFVDLTPGSYLKGLWSAKKRTEEARKITDDRWAYRFRQKYIRDRVRLASEENRGGANGPLTAEKAKLFQEYLELKLPKGIPPEQLEVDEGKGSAVDPLKNQDIIGETGRAKVAKVSTDERAPEFPDVPLMPKERMNLAGIEQIPIVPVSKPDAEPVNPEKTIEELKADLDAKRVSYARFDLDISGRWNKLKRVLGFRAEEIKDSGVEEKKNGYKEALKKYKDAKKASLGNLTKEQAEEILYEFTAGEALKFLEVKGDESAKMKKEKGEWPENVMNGYINIVKNFRSLSFKKKILISVSIMAGGAVAGMTFGVVGASAFTIAGAGYRAISGGATGLGLKKLMDAISAKREKKAISKEAKGILSQADWLNQLDAKLDEAVNTMDTRIGRMEGKDLTRKRIATFSGIFVGSGAMAQIIHSTGLGGFLKEKLVGGGTVKSSVSELGSGAAATQTQEAFYSHSPDGKITGLTPQGDEHFKQYNIEPHDYDKYQKPSVISEPEAEQPPHQEYSGETRETEGGANFEESPKLGTFIEEARTSPTEGAEVQTPEIAEPSSKLLGYHEVKPGGGIEKSAKEIIKANAKAFGLDPDDPKLNTKAGHKAHVLARGLAEKYGMSYEDLNKIASNHVQKGDQIRIFQDPISGKMNLTYNGAAFDNALSPDNISQVSVPEEIAPSKGNIPVEDVKPKASVAPEDVVKPRTGVADHQPSRGGGEIAEMKEIEADYQKDLADRQYARTVRAEQDLSALHERQAAHLENVGWEAGLRQSVATRGLLKNIIHEAGIGNNVSLWDESAEKWYGEFANMEKLVSQDVLHNDDITDINKKREILKAIFSQLPKPRPGENTWQAFLRNISEDPNNLVKINRALGRR